MVRVLAAALCTDAWPDEKDPSNGDPRFELAGSDPISIQSKDRIELTGLDLLETALPRLYLAVDLSSLLIDGVRCL